MPMLRAAAQISLLKQLPARAMSGLSEFIDIVHRLQGLAEKLPAAELCRALVTQSGLVAALQAPTRDPAVFDRRPANLEELADWFAGAASNRSEEHTSELQSQIRISYAVFCLKKKQQNNIYLHPLI